MPKLDAFTFYYGTPVPEKHHGKTYCPTVENHENDIEAIIDQHQELKGWTGLHIAVSAGDVKKVKWLVKHDADVNSLDSLGRTPLHYAAEAGNVDIIAVLVNAGADETIKDNAQGHTPACKAKESGMCLNYRMGLYNAEQMKKEDSYYAWFAETVVPVREDFCEHGMINLSWTPTLIWKKTSRDAI